MSDAPIPAVQLRVPRADVSRRVARIELQRSMTEHASVLRDAASLAKAASVAGVQGEDPETENLCTISRALCAAAAIREESRGAHARRDFPALSARFLARYAMMG